MYMQMSEKELSPSRAKYLIVLTELDPEGKGIRSISIANKLHISRPSVHAMLTKLEDMGYVKKEHYGIVYLTDAGLEMGRKLASEQHDSL